MKNKVQLITYADRLGDGNLASLTDILRPRFAGAYEGVHILPFFTPFDGADAGFAAQSMLVTTVLSLITIPLWAAVYFG